MTTSQRIKLTLERIAQFKWHTDGPPQQFLRDTEIRGFAIRATRTVKCYIFESKLNGETIRLKIGDCDEWKLSDAQDKANEYLRLINQGIDPRQKKAHEVAQIKLETELAIAEAERLRREREAEQAEMQRLAIQQAEADRRNSVTLGDAWPVYIQARTRKWSELHLRDHLLVAQAGGEPKKRGKGLTEAGVLASLMPLKLTELTGHRIAEWLEFEVAKRPARAKLAFRLLSVFINWCESHFDYQGLVPAGACKTTQVKDELPKSKTKDGDCLEREQLPRWFAAVRGLNNPCASAYLQGLLLTGARRRELAGLKWADIDFEWNSLTIRDKVEGERTIPLTPYFKHLLLNLPRRNEWVFSSASSESGQLVEPTAPHHRALLAANLPHVTLHGLRRSFSTLAEWTESPTGVVAQIMGHKPSAVSERHYIRRSLDLLRLWHINIEAWFVTQGQVDFDVKAGLTGYGLHLGSHKNPEQMLASLFLKNYGENDLIALTDEEQSELVRLFAILADLSTEGESVALFESLQHGLNEAIAYQNWKMHVANESAASVVDVAAIRSQTGLSQEEFAVQFGFSVNTLQQWELRAFQPFGSARVLLQIIAKNPQGVLESLTA